MSKHVIFLLLLVATAGTAQHMELSAGINYSRLYPRQPWQYDFMQSFGGGTGFQVGLAIDSISRALPFRADIMLARYTGSRRDDHPGHTVGYLAEGKVNKLQLALHLYVVNFRPGKGPEINLGFHYGYNIHIEPGKGTYHNYFAGASRDSDLADHVQRSNYGLSGRIGQKIYDNGRMYLLLQYCFSWSLSEEFSYMEPDPTRAVRHHLSVGAGIAL